MNRQRLGMQSLLILTCEAAIVSQAGSFYIIIGVVQGQSASAMGLCAAACVANGGPFASADAKQLCLGQDTWQSSLPLISVICERKWGPPTVPRAQRLQELVPQSCLAPRRNWPLQTLHLPSLRCAEAQPGKASALSLLHSTPPPKTSYVMPRLPTPPAHLQRQ